MLPILLENSRQAQVLLPMATSLSFGLIFATFIVLLLGPAIYLVATRAARAVAGSKTAESHHAAAYANVTERATTEPASAT